MRHRSGRTNIMSMSGKHDFPLPEFITRFHLESFFMLAALLAAGFLFFWKCLGYGITFLDDYALLTQYKPLLSSPSNISQFFTTTLFPEASAFYRPVLLLSFLWDFTAGEGTYFYFHLTNLLLHILAAFSLYLFLKEICPRNPRIFLTFLYMFCPLLVSGAAWIPGRNDSLLAIFVLTSFYFTTLFTESESKKYLAAVFLFSLAAMFTKENASMLIIAVPWLVWCLDNEKSMQSDYRRKILLAFAAVLPAFLVWYFMRAAARPFSGEIQVAAFFNSSLYIPHLFGKMFFPFLPEPAYELHEISIGYAFIIPAVILIFYFFVSERENSSIIVFGLSLFFMFGATTFLSEKPVIPGRAYWLEHRYYLPYAGLLVAMSQIMIPICNKKCRTYFMPAGFAVLAISAVVSFCYMPVFRDKASFWTKVAERQEYCDNALALTGDAYFDRWQINNDNDNLKKAMEAYSEAEQIKNKTGKPHMDIQQMYNYGIVCIASGDIEKAEMIYNIISQEIPQKYAAALKERINSQKAEQAVHSAD